jgi:putative hemolysin
MSGSQWLGLLAVIVLVLMNGFFVAAEFALVSVRKSRIDQLVQEGNRAARGVQKALVHLDTYIAATQEGRQHERPPAAVAPSMGPIPVT